MVAKTSPRRVFWPLPLRHLHGTVRSLQYNPQTPELQTDVRRRWRLRRLQSDPNIDPLTE